MAVSDWNKQVIEEFRSNGGRVGGTYADRPLLLLNTKGAKSGETRTTPLAYLTDGDRLIVFASMLGAPKHPAWYYNLVAHPEVTVEIGAEKFNAIATTATGEERDRLWAKASTLLPVLNEHQAKTTRQIPLVILQR